jgi:hypothetical protein
LKSTRLFPTLEQIEVPEALKAELFPHFMEKNEKKTYRSTSILGKIYDKVKAYEDMDLSSNGEGFMNLKIEAMSLMWWLSFSGHENYLKIFFIFLAFTNIIIKLSFIDAFSTC